MKKLISVLAVITLLAVLIAGCGGGSSGAVKTGLGVIISQASSADAGDEDGLAQADTTAAAVTVDASGKIVDCVIDAVQSKINFDAAGNLVTPMDTTFATKNELGANYGMAGASGIGKEWNEQAAAFAEYCKGKTVDEIKGIAVDETGHATGSDLSSSVTVSIGWFQAAVEKAVSSAAELGASSGDKLGLGIVTDMSHSAPVGEEDGLAQAYSTYVAATAGADGKVTSCVVDGSQANVAFDAAGKITSDTAAPVATKDELGADYGMAGASGIGKEWNEQAAAFAEYCKGKTAADIAGIAVDEAGHPTGSDLASSVTVSVGNFQAAAAKALA